MEVVQIVYLQTHKTGFLFVCKSISFSNTNLEHETKTEKPQIGNTEINPYKITLT